MSSDSLFVGAVTLLTFGGVFFYLLRVDALSRRLESEVRALEAEKSLENRENIAEPIAKP